MIDRRDFHRIGTFVLGGLMGLALAVPGVGYLLDPLRKKAQGDPTTGDEAEGEFVSLARLEELTPGVPRVFPVVATRQDAWVKYPREPVGSVWLVRQAEGEEPAVLAFSAECPHLGCSISLGPGGAQFVCPCHTSAFSLDGDRLNEVPPRGMDRLEVAPLNANDPVVRVKFQRFRTMSKEKIPLG